MEQRIVITSILITTISATNPLEIVSLCDKGEFFNPKASHCEECPANSYMAEANHGNLACKPCTKYSTEIDHVKQTSDCTRFQDREILQCEDGFYKDTRPQGSECRPCPQCPNNLPGCCSHEELATEPNIRTTPSLTKKVNMLSSVEPGSDSSGQVDDNHSTTMSPITPAEEYLRCETISPEECQHDNLTGEKCFREMQIVSCKECPECRTATRSSSAPHLSTAWIVIIIISGICGALAVTASIVYYTKHKKNQYQPANENEDL